jgi:hypothetical protein
MTCIGIDSHSSMSYLQGLGETTSEPGDGDGDGTEDMDDQRHQGPARKKSRVSMATTSEGVSKQAPGVIRSVVGHHAADGSSHKCPGRPGKQEVVQIVIQALYSIVWYTSEVTSQ